VEVLQVKGPEDLRELWLELAGWMLLLGGASPTVAEGKQQSAKLISSGKALDKFRQMIELQGGDARVIDEFKRLPQAQHTVQIAAAKSGFIASMQCEQIGTACVILGGGRERKEDSVDPSVGIVLHKKVGDRIAVGEPLATIHYNSEAKAARAQQLIEGACEIAPTAPPKRPLVHRIIGKVAG
jgi:thymidine phosphorylase